MPDKLPLNRRHVLQASLGAAAWAATAHTTALAAGSAPPVPDLAKVTLRIGTYKGLWRALLAASGQGQTPYRIEWRELNNGVLHIEALNGDALDLGSGSEIPALFAARQKAQVRFIAITREDLNNQVTLARKDAPIQRIADLKGKRVCVGDQGSGSETNAKQVLEAYGLSYDDFDVQYLSFSEASTAMQNGTVDAAFATSALPNSAIQELSKMKEIVVIPIDGEGADKLLEKHPFYAKTVIPAATYGVKEAETVAMLATLVCSEDLDEAVVYQITKHLFEEQPAMAAGHARGGDLDINKALDGVTVDFHDGALRYYREQGVID